MNNFHRRLQVSLAGFVLLLAEAVVLQRFYFDPPAARVPKEATMLRHILPAAALVLPAAGPLAPLLPIIIVVALLGALLLILQIPFIKRWGIWITYAQYFIVALIVIFVIWQAAVISGLF